MPIQNNSLTKDSVDEDLEGGFSEETKVTKPAGSPLELQKEQSPTSPPPPSPSPSSPTSAVHTVVPTAVQPGSPEGKAGVLASRVPANEQNQHEPEDAPVAITKGTLDRLLAAADGQIQLRAEITRLNGTVGSYKKIIEDISKGGGIVDIDENDPDWKQFAVDYPEIAKGTKRGLELAAKKIGAKVPAGASEDVVKKSITDRVLTLETEALEDEFPDWRKTVGDHPGAKTEFRDWLAKQPKEYNDRVQNTLSAAVLGRAIRKFEAEKKTTKVPTPPTARPASGVRSGAPAGGVRKVISQVARRDRLRGAVTPRGDGGGSPARRAEVDPFEEGFKTG